MQFEQLSYEKLIKWGEWLLIAISITFSPSLSTITEHNGHIKHTMLFNISSFEDMDNDEFKPTALMINLLWLTITIGILECTKKEV